MELEDHFKVELEDEWMEEVAVFFPPFFQSWKVKVDESLKKVGEENDDKILVVELRFCEKNSGGSVFFFFSGVVRVACRTCFRHPFLQFYVFHD